MAQEKFLDEELTAAFKAHLNVLVTGETGIGKTEIAKAAAKKANLEVRYFSLTMITHQDLLIPVPNHEDETIQYYFYKLLDSDKPYVLILDEFNRSSVQTENAVLELVQHKTIMGRPMRNMVSVVALMNPDGSDDEDSKRKNNMTYYTRPLDPASIGRFHVYYDADDKNTGWEDYLLGKYGDTMVPFVHWRSTLSDDNKAWVPPRKVEQSHQAYHAGIPLEHCFATPGLPTTKLKAMIDGKEILTLDVLIAKNKEIAQRLKKQEPELAIQVGLIAKSVTDVKTARKIADAVRACGKQYHIAVLRAHRDRLNVMEALFPKDFDGDDDE